MSEIASMIRQIADRREEVYSVVAVVSTVDTNARTCDVVPVNGTAEIFGVRLQPTPNNAEGWFVVPAISSHVVVTFLNRELAYLALCDKVDKVMCAIGMQILEYTNQGLSMRSPSSDIKSEMNRLADELDKLCTTLTTFQVSVPAFGPSAFVMPQVVASLNGHKAQIALFKQNLNTMLV